MIVMRSDEELDNIFLGYIVTVLKNTSISYNNKLRNKHSKEFLLDIDEIPDGHNSAIKIQRAFIEPDKKVELEYLQNKFKNLFSGLNDREQVIFIEKFFNEKFDKEIGEMLNISSQAILKQKRKIKDKILLELFNDLEG